MKGKVASILRYCLGLFFVFSALAKFIDLDRLYIYIFSFDFLSLNLSVVAGWLVTSVEFILGLFLLANRRLREVLCATLLLLVGFTLVLGYAQIIGRTDNCHCMGEVMTFNPLTSILKNAFLILIVLWVWRFGVREEECKSCFCRKVLPALLLLLPEVLLVLGGFRGWWGINFYDLQYSLTLIGCLIVVEVLLCCKVGQRLWLQLLAALTPIVALFIFSAYISLFGGNNGEAFNNAMLQRQIASEGLLGDAHLGEGRKVVALYSTSCNYCRMASQKVSLIQRHNDLPYEQFVNIFPGNDSTDVTPFFENDQMEHYAHLMLPRDTFLYITYGQVPLVLLIDNGEVVQTFSHSDVSEIEICKFLKEF